MLKREHSNPEDATTVATASFWHLTDHAVVK
jgi:hypothetical protein